MIGQRIKAAVSAFRSSVAESIEDQVPGEAYSPVGTREQPELVSRFEAAETNRLTAAHWVNAQGQTMNADLANHLTTLRSRCEYEARNNAILAGVINTHKTDVVTPDGPSLQVVVSFPRGHKPTQAEKDASDAYSDWHEAHWYAWADMPDIEGRRHLVDFLMEDVGMEWTGGESLARMVDVWQEPTPVTMRLMSLHARRLDTPPGSLADPEIVLGVKRINSRPVSYYIDMREEDAFGVAGAPKYEEVPAEQVVHEFQVLEPGQQRGVPLAAPCLSVIADIRDLDKEVLDAIRAAADNAVLLTTTHDDVPVVSVPTGAARKIQRRQITVVPAGYDAKQMKPEQPGTNVMEFRAEKLREVGLPVGMPLMKVILDAKKQNFSQAKFGSGNYWRSIDAFRRRIERRKLSRWAKIIRKEAELYDIAHGNGVPQLPRNARLTYQWGWPAAPSTDKRIDAMGDALMRAIGQLSMTDLLASVNKTTEQHAQEIRREQQVYEDAGVEYPQPKDVRETLTAVSTAANVTNNNEANDE